MFNRFAAVIIFCAGLLPSSNVHATIFVEFDLAVNSVTSSQASLDVSLQFTGDPGDQIEGYQLSVIGSDPLLTNGGTDFSRFGFVPNTSVAPLSSWLGSGTLATSGLELGFPLDPLFGPFLLPSSSPLTLGTILVDLTGLAVNAPLHVSLNAGIPGLDTDVFGTFGGTFVPSLAAEGNPDLVLAFADPSGVQFTTPTVNGGVVPEPGSLVIWCLAGMVLVGNLWRRRRSVRVKHSRI